MEVQSLKREWFLKKVDKQLVKKISEEFKISSLLAKLLVNRGIDTKDKIRKFLKPDLFKDMYDPFLFSDMKKAVERIVKAFSCSEKIVIFGDYDADGITATALLYNFFTFVKLTQKLNFEIDYILPDRVLDGYGITENGVEKAKEISASLIITVDNGVSSYEAVEYANENNIDVIITDHHLITNDLPNAYAVINPHKSNCQYPNKNIVGVGIAFKLAEALADHYMDISWKEKVLKRYLDLVAIGTYQDVALIEDENRLFIKFGIEVLNKTLNGEIDTKLLGIKKLVEMSHNKKVIINHKTLGFMIGPRINASGRIDSPDRAFELLVTLDDKRAGELAKELNELNYRRQKLKKKGVQEAIDVIEKEKLYQHNIIILRSAEWHKGVIGLIASEIKEKYYKPTIILTYDDEAKMLSASCRSIDGFNIGEAVSLFGKMCVSYGGHANAAGFTIRDSMYEQFTVAIMKHADEVISNKSLSKKIAIDEVLHYENLDDKLIEDIKKLEPFGEGNDEPVFCFERVIIIDMRISKRGMDTIVFFRKGNKSFNSVVFKNIEFYKRFSSGDIVDITFRVSGRDGFSELSIEIIDIRFSKRKK